MYFLYLLLSLRNLHSPVRATQDSRVSSDRDKSLALHFFPSQNHDRVNTVFDSAHGNILLIGNVFCIYYYYFTVATTLAGFIIVVIGARILVNLHFFSLSEMQY